MESAAKVTTTIMLQPELRELLDDEAARLDRSRSWVAARAIDFYLHRATDSVSHEASRPGVAAMPDVPVPGGAPDGATEGFSSSPNLPSGGLFLRSHE
jgi:hypothetical protein